jgi:uncharacterized protein
MRTDWFRAYVSLADNGFNTWPRIAATLVLVVVVTILATAGLIAALVALTGGWFGIDDLADSLATPFGGAVTLLAGAALWLGLAAGLRLLHRRPLASIIGHDGWEGRRDLFAGVIVGIAVPLAAGLLTIPIGPVPERSGVAAGTWLLLLLPIAALILVQSAAEEAFFRGYLPQVLAAKRAGPLVWFVVPTLLFATLHWYDSVPLWKNLAVIVSIAVFAVGMMILVIRTGRIAAACGVHWGNNIVALQFVTLDEGFAGLALYQLPPLSDPAWTAITLGAQVVITVPVTALQVALLLHPRSPLRIGAG